MRTPSLILAVLFLSIAAQAKVPVVEYRLSMPEPWTQLFQVEISLSGIPTADRALDFVLPAWRPGRYVLFDFAGGVVDFSARDGQGKLLVSSKVDKNTWRVQKGGATQVTLRYRVFANDFANRTRGLNDRHGFVDGSAVFMYLPEYRFLPVTLTVVPYADWHVTTGLDSVAGERFRFTAPGYDDLIDCPLEIGNQRDYSFEVMGRPHVISIYGPLNCSVDSLIRDVITIVTMNGRFWGGLPYKRYVFLFHAIPGSGGGTEHMNSAVMGIAPGRAREADPCTGIRGLISHEFFHTWNVKRLRPKGMDPYRWAGENYSRELWMAEGSTSYLHGLLMLRSGMVTEPQYLQGIAGSIQSERGRPGNAVQSLTDCSFDSWVKSMRSGQETYNFQTDIYGKGAQASMMLDLEIRQRSANAHSFDDLIRTLYLRFPLGSGGYTVDDVERIAGELAGGSMKGFFESYIRGTVPLDWEKGLGYAGLQVFPADSNPRPRMGIVAGEENGKAVVRVVVAGSPAYVAGVNAGDQVVAVDGYRVTSADLGPRIQTYAVGDSIALTVFREERLREFRFRLDADTLSEFRIQKVRDPSPLQRKIFSDWLRSGW